MNARELEAALAVPGQGWLRGVGYHECVTGALIDRHWLDRFAPQRPMRVQHRTGRLWIFNSAGLAALRATGLQPPAGLDSETGRLFDEDGWARRALGGRAPGFAAIGAAYARCGVTGVTDMTPGNGAAAAAHFAREHASGALPQRVVLAGAPDLAILAPGVSLGPVKFHLHEAHLPEFEVFVAAIEAAHSQRRAVAVHCVTAAELVFTLAALRDAGVAPGDRIEHASVTPDAQLQEIATQGIAVVVQPHFVAERGDAYLADIPADDWPDLYRLRSFLAAGVALAGGSDTPFGDLDPWAVMRAAVTRSTAGGQMLGLREALTPEAALNLFLADPAALSGTRIVAMGEAADLCLLAKPWRAVRETLSAKHVCATIIGGRLIDDRVDQPPLQGGCGAYAPA
ncbi:amidohydrolase [Acidocella aquatica]|uniref:Amidohydrolase n=2 Tax=Acidocella aquatica TaxID=1922313 RepID=A0ABQ6A4P1_9PROT|nr:amidohydrolase [Acidocella aquatica]